MPSWIDSGAAQVEKVDDDSDEELYGGGGGGGGGATGGGAEVKMEDAGMEGGWGGDMEYDDDEDEAM